MAWRGKQRNTNFLLLPRRILWSKACIELTLSARAALPYWLDKPKCDPKHPEHYTKEFAFPYIEANKLGFAARTWSRIIDQVIAHGFVDPVSKGGCFGDLKACNRFTLSNRWMQFGKAEFKHVDWKSFGPEK